MNRTHPIRFFYVAVLVIAAGAFVPVLLFDKFIFIKANGWHFSLADQIWLILTATGDGLVLGIIVGAFIVVNPRVVAMGIPLLLLTSLTVNIIKAIFPSLRPVEVLDAVHVVGPLLRSGSFPSGHAAAAMAAGLSIAFYGSSRSTGLLALFIAFLIGISRIFVAAHFPKDVLAGMVCAFVLFLIVKALFVPFIENRIPDRPSFRGKTFWAAFWLEIIAALFTMLIYGPYYSELPAVPMFVAAVVLIWIARRYKSASNRIVDSNPSQTAVAG
jgi:membrane-associated phospholipid phosphatase